MCNHAVTVTVRGLLPWRRYIVCALCDHRERIISAGTKLATG